MTLPDLQAGLDRLGVVLSARGDRLVIDAPAGALTPEIKAALATHKPALLARLADPPWSPRRPPAVVEEIGGWPIPWRQRWGELCNAFEDEGVPFPESERRAYDEVKTEMETAP